ncbi:MAG: Stealth CR1 domain-containing protein [Dysgonomonas sp.]
MNNKHRMKFQMSSTPQIDIVIPWVDGNDPQWRARYNEYRGDACKGDKSEIRFRDWDLLRYWFRGIEKFMPWARKIHFITSGEFPDWLKKDHPKLNWVRHEDFIPRIYLPTFNINAIEMNIHRIEGLAEHFIYFNDDFFLLKPQKERDFFYKGQPCDLGVMSAKPAMGGIIHVAINNLEVLGSRFDKHASMKKSFGKWFSLKYGSKMMNNVLLYPWREFSGFIDPHIASPFCKSTYDKIWEFAPDVLTATSERKFRSNDDVNQWLVRYWQLAEGNFHPKNTLKNTKCLDISDKNLSLIEDIVANQRYDIICMNDSEDISDFEEVQNRIKESFNKILPQKSTFEKF